jgi:hypothetical protein
MTKIDRTGRDAAGPFTLGCIVRRCLEACGRFSEPLVGR